VIRVGVLGAAGRMGRMVCRAVLDDPDLDLVAAVDPSHAGDPVAGTALTVSEDPSALAEASAEVAVDFTRPDAVMANVRWLLNNGVHVVVGTSGVGATDLEEIERLLPMGGPNVVVVPNFAIGAVLMQRFAEMAAAHMPAAEIVELHHEGKLDAPSGTAIATAARIAAARRGSAGGHVRGPEHSLAGARGADVDGVPVHSLRLPGLVAHQEVIFGATGQTLTIRHDTTDRVSFMPGVLLAVKAVGARPGLTVGLEPILGLGVPG
jgi:4-hydroxy-tetrahydrodipicolinate reductase